MENWVPSGKRLQFAIENGPIEIVDLPINSMVICHSFFVCLPEGIYPHHVPIWSWNIGKKHANTWMEFRETLLVFTSSFSDSNLFWTWIFPTKYELLTWGSWKNMDRKGVCLKKNWENLCIQPTFITIFPCKLARNHSDRSSFFQTHPLPTSAGLHTYIYIHNTYIYIYT